MSSTNYLSINLNMWSSGGWRSERKTRGETEGKMYGDGGQQVSPIGAMSKYQVT